MRTEYPDKYFHYGIEGRGLVLPHGFVYISTEAAEEIRTIVDGKITIGPTLDLINTEFRSVEGTIPDEAIADIIAFTAEVKVKMDACRERLPQQ